jgi:hypothetical protein
MDSMIEVKLEAKPIPVPLTYQPIYKIVLLLAVLQYACSKPYRATFLKLHLYMWGMRSNKNAYILRSIAKKRRSTIAPWNYEPGLERVITLSIVSGYCNRCIASQELQIELTDAGKDLLKKIEEAGYFSEDISRIKSIGKIPQGKLVAANENWTIK